MQGLLLLVTSCLALPHPELNGEHPDPAFIDDGECVPIKCDFGIPPPQCTQLCAFKHYIPVCRPPGDFCLCQRLRDGVLELVSPDEVLDESSDQEPLVFSLFAFIVPLDELFWVEKTPGDPESTEPSSALFLEDDVPDPPTTTLADHQVHVPEHPKRTYPDRLRKSPDQSGKTHPDHLRRPNFHNASRRMSLDNPGKETDSLKTTPPNQYWAIPDSAQEFVVDVNVHEGRLYWLFRYVLTGLFLLIVALMLFEVIMCQVQNYDKRVFGMEEEEPISKKSRTLDYI